MSDLPSKVRGRYRVTGQRGPEGRIRYSLTRGGEVIGQFTKYTKALRRMRELVSADAPGV